MALNLVSTVYEEDDANDDATDQEGRDFLSGRRQITPSVPSSPPINNPPDDCRVNTEDPTIAEFLPPADESPNLPYYLRDVPCSNLDLPRASLNVVDCLPHLRMPSSDVFAAENKSVSSKDTFSNSRSLLDCAHATALLLNSVRLALHSCTVAFGSLILSIKPKAGPVQPIIGKPTLNRG